MSQNEGKKKLFGDIKQAKAELTEKEVYNELSKFIKNKEHSTLLIHGVELPLHLPERQGKQEIDFLLVNYTKQYILNVEVKKSLTPIKNKPGQSTTKNAQKQLLRIRTLLNRIFGSVLKGQWKIMSMVSCHELEESVENCNHCHQFVSKGAPGIIQRIQAFEQSLEINDFQKFPRDFQEIAKYLLFCLPLLPLPVTGIHHKFVSKAVTEKVGSVENIKLWAFPTPEQRAILKSPKLIFAAPWGAGKTILMVHEAIEIAKRDEKVLFLIFHNGNRHLKSTLLYLQLRQHFKDHENITIKQVNYRQYESLVDLTEGFQHIFADELFWDLPLHFKKATHDLQILIQEKQTLWIALSNFYDGTCQMFRQGVLHDCLQSQLELS